MIKQEKKKRIKENKSIKINLQKLKFVNFEYFVMELSPFFN